MSGEPKLSKDQLAALLADLPGWEAGHDRIRKKFIFPTFSNAFGFMCRVALECEKLDHHPNWYNCYGLVEVELWTHRASGVTGLDVRLAHTMNEIAASSGVEPPE